MSSDFEFEYREPHMDKFLQVVRENPDACQREIETLMTRHYRWRRGITNLYMKEAVRREVLKPVAAGYRNRIHYVVTELPQ